MSVNLEILHVPDCPNLPVMLEHLRAVTDLPIATREITTDADAATAGMNGSPTLLINGHDVFAAPARGLSCRIYRDEHGHLVGAPSPAQLREALTVAEHPPASASARPGEVLNTWRTRALPLEPTQKAMHQAILRAFATTGRPPALADLDPVAGSGRDTGDMLTALHDLDAIRLAPDGQIAVAYPFSTTPTRHRVRIGDRTDVYAMCALDALGMAAMLDQDTHIHSADPTTDQPITVTTTAGHTNWEPSTAVVFLGATAGGGPSADCCCDYLNFFTSAATVNAWTRAHPNIPGQILNQADAEALGTRLFGPLLAGG